jgi:galactitol-specific phosphotransferase system IIB component
MQIETMNIAVQYIIVQVEDIIRIMGNAELWVTSQKVNRSRQIITTKIFVIESIIS